MLTTPTNSRSCNTKINSNSNNTTSSSKIPVPKKGTKPLKSLVSTSFSETDIASLSIDSPTTSLKKVVQNEIYNSKNRTDDIIHEFKNFSKIFEKKNLQKETKSTTISQTPQTILKKLSRIEGTKTNESSQTVDHGKNSELLLPNESSKNTPNRILALEAKRVTKFLNKDSVVFDEVNCFFNKENDNILEDLIDLNDVNEKFGNNLTSSIQEPNISEFSKISTANSFDLTPALKSALEAKIVSNYGNGVQNRNKTTFKDQSTIDENEIIFDFEENIYLDEHLNFNVKSLIKKELTADVEENIDVEGTTDEGKISEKIDSVTASSNDKMVDVNFKNEFLYKTPEELKSEEIEISETSMEAVSFKCGIDAITPELSESLLNEEQLAKFFEEEPKDSTTSKTDDVLTLEDLSQSHSKFSENDQCRNSFSDQENVLEGSFKTQNFITEDAINSDYNLENYNAKNRNPDEDGEIELSFFKNELNNNVPFSAVSERTEENSILKSEDEKKESSDDSDDQSDYNSPSEQRRLRMSNSLPHKEKNLTEEKIDLTQIKKSIYSLPNKHIVAGETMNFVPKECNLEIKKVLKCDKLDDNFNKITSSICENEQKLNSDQPKTEIVHIKSEETVFFNKSDDQILRQGPGMLDSNTFMVNSKMEIEISNELHKLSKKSLVDSVTKTGGLTGDLMEKKISGNYYGFSKDEKPGLSEVTSTENNSEYDILLEKIEAEKLYQRSRSEAEQNSTLEKNVKFITPINGNVTKKNKSSVLGNYAFLDADDLEKSRSIIFKRNPKLDVLNETKFNRKLETDVDTGLTKTKKKKKTILFTSLIMFLLLMLLFLYRNVEFKDKIDFYFNSSLIIQYFKRNVLETFNYFFYEKPKFQKFSLEALLLRAEKTYHYLYSLVSSMVSNFLESFLGTNDLDYIPS
ncbi:hypothetical protein HK099_000002 [Clydaea vesicula]|uniref:Uncharacterized protein n=1 Tax=Clydaea vesicula TaxID=447962 RepID=A0AAD5UBW5_9FUNG|nr:hypothetical protein HK099_000002 [Clydaea vesicula]